MWAIIEMGGQQHKVDVGKRVRVHRLAGEAGAEVVCEKVLCVAGGGAPVFGTPYLTGAKVSAKVLAQGRDPKVIVFKQKQRKGYRRKYGHRQPYTDIVVTAITAPGA